MSSAVVAVACADSAARLSLARFPVSSCCFLPLLLVSCRATRWSRREREGLEREREWPRENQSELQVSKRGFALLVVSVRFRKFCNSHQSVTGQKATTACGRELHFYKHSGVLYRSATETVAVPNPYWCQISFWYQPNFFFFLYLMISNFIEILGMKLLHKTQLIVIQHFCPI